MGGCEVELYCNHFITVRGGSVVAGTHMRGLEVNLTARKTKKKSQRKISFLVSLHLSSSDQAPVDPHIAFIVCQFEALLLFCLFTIKIVLVDTQLLGEWLWFPVTALFLQDSGCRGMCATVPVGVQSYME